VLRRYSNKSALDMSAAWWCPEKSIMIEMNEEDGVEEVISLLVREEEEEEEERVVGVKKRSEKRS
jgi:hypothetical protein